MAALVKTTLLFCGLLVSKQAFAQSAPAEKDATAPVPAPKSDKPAPPATAAAPAQNSNILVERGNSGQKLFRITEGLVVEGQRQKPNAFYVLQRMSAPYDWETLDENFLPRILKAAEKPPF